MDLGPDFEHEERLGGQAPRVAHHPDPGAGRSGKAAHARGSERLCASYRGYNVKEPILRIQTTQGIEGIAFHSAKSAALQKLIGLDPFALFEWNGDLVRGPAEEYRALLGDLYGGDAALFDILGKALRRPVADLLGKRVRNRVPVYDSSLYMEDLLTAEQRQDLVYLRGKPPENPAEMVARKAEWLLERPGGVQILKIKIGRIKWMKSFEEALQRDIDVVHAIRRSVGAQATLFVDGNDGYQRQPLAAADFAQAVAADGVYAMEEMFSEEKIVEAKAVKQRLRAAGIATRLADGENHRDGIPERIRAERFAAPQKIEPLFDIEQADMNANGYLRMQTIAQKCVPHGMTVAPHNFGSKLGFYTQIHLGLVTSNWEFCETDDSQFPALEAPGIRIKGGKAELTGQPGLGLELRESHLDKATLSLGS